MKGREVVPGCSGDPLRVIVFEVARKCQRCQDRADEVGGCGTDGDLNRAQSSHNQNRQDMISQHGPVAAGGLTGGLLGRAGLARWTWRDWQRLGLELYQVTT